MDLHARQHDDDDGGEKDEDDDLPDNRHQAFNATGLGMEGAKGMIRTLEWITLECICTQPQDIN